MDIKDIQELIKFVAKSGATEVDLEIDNIKISIKSPPKKRRGEIEETIQVIQQPQTAPAMPIMHATPQTTIEKNIKNEPTDAKIDEAKENDESNYITINASMIGTFYRSSSPETPPFINIGDKIKEGDPICIIEAMKLFNEIEAEVSGTVIKVLVDDATPIEFDQPLLLIDPS